MKQVRGSTIRKKEKARARTFGESLTSYRDVLDAVLKTVVVFLLLSAIQTYTYLKLIGHEELFASATSSVAGLYTLLQASSLLCVVLFLCAAGPSILISVFDGMRKHAPSKALVGFAWISALLTAAVYGMVFGFLGSEPATPGVMGAIAGCIIIFFFVLFGIAWWSPSWLAVAPRNDGTDSARTHTGGGATQHPLAKRLQKIWSWSPRFWRCAAPATAMFAAGWFSVLTINTVYGFGDAFALPSDGWGAAGVMGSIVFASFLPGLVFFALRGNGVPRNNAFKMTAYITAAVLAVGPISLRYIAPTVTIATMRVIGVVDLKPRTYEILKADERQVYRELGYAQASLPSPDYRFVKAVIGFQMTDVKLVCPRPFVFPRGWMLEGNLSHFHVDSTGCLVAGKDELRLVDEPDNADSITGASRAQRRGNQSGVAEGSGQMEGPGPVTPVADLVRFMERFSIGLAMILGGGVLGLVMRRSWVAIATGVGVSAVGLALSITARGKLEFTAVHLDQLIGSLQISYASKHDMSVQPRQDFVFAHIASIGPFPAAMNELDAGAVTGCMAGAIKSLGTPAPSGWHIVGGVDKRALRADRAAVYGTNQALAMARAVWVRDNVLAKAEGAPVESEAMVTIAGASNVGATVDDAKLAADRSVQLYAFVSKAQGARAADVVSCR